MESLLLLLLSVGNVQTSYIAGLVLIKNPPSIVAIGNLNTSTGMTTILQSNNPSNPVSAAMGSLSAVDPTNLLLYYLGESSAGTTLVGMDLKTGATVCSGVLPFVELADIGLGQSISFDGVGGLLLTGLVTNPDDNSTDLHGILRTKGCDSAGNIAPLQNVGTFGDAKYVPVLHSSTFDVNNQRLFIQLGTSQSATGIGVVDLRTKKDHNHNHNHNHNHYQKNTHRARAATATATAAAVTAASAAVWSKLPFSVIPLDTPAQMSMVGMQYDAATNSVLSVVQNQSTGGLDLIGLSVDAKTEAPTWTIRSLPRQRYEWLYGNLGAVSAFDSSRGMLYMLAGERPSRPGVFPPMHLVGVDVKAGIVTSAPLVTGLPLGTDTIFEMNFIAQRL